MEKLALFGGRPVIENSLPSRRQFGTEAELAAKEVFDYYNKLDRDFGTNGYFYKSYADCFSNYLCPSTTGFTEVVCSGTVSIYVAIQSLCLPSNSEVLVSPITDPGMINPVILSGLRPKLVDYDLEKQDVSLKAIISQITKNTKLIILNHLAGRPIEDIELIASWARDNNIYLIEDASQCHGGRIHNRRVGTFGDISCFSTMFSKNHSSGGTGGLIYTQSSTLHQKILLEIDKGKPIYSELYLEKDPNTFLKPALNFRLNELSCAIGQATLNQLDDVNSRRRSFLKQLSHKLKTLGAQTTLLDLGEQSAPFFGVFKFNTTAFKCSKIDFAEALRAEGVNINTDYKYCVYDWSWVKNYLVNPVPTQNAKAFLDTSFNLLFNENYTEREADLITQSFLKIERHYSLL